MHTHWARHKSNHHLSPGGGRGGTPTQTCTAHVSSHTDTQPNAHPRQTRARAHAHSNPHPHTWVPGRAKRGGGGGRARHRQRSSPRAQASDRSSTTGALPTASCLPPWRCWHGRQRTLAYALAQALCVHWPEVHCITAMCLLGRGGWQGTGRRACRLRRGGCAPRTARALAGAAACWPPAPDFVRWWWRRALQARGADGKGWVSSCTRKHFVCLHGCQVFCKGLSCTCLRFCVFAWLFGVVRGPAQWQGHKPCVGCAVCGGGGSAGAQA